MTLNPRSIVCAGMVWGLAALSAPPVEAGMLYVRTSGDDANSGATPAAAVRTVGRAAALAVADDIVVVGPGTYAEGDIKPAAFGRVRFVADRRGALVGDAAGDVVIDATGFTAGFELNRQLAMSVDGFVIYGASIGIYVKTSSHGAVISNNIVCNNNTNGIYVQDSRDAVIFNNLVYNNGRTGILLTGDLGAANAKVINNTVYLNLNRGIYFSPQVGSPDGLVLNNVVARNRIAGIQVNVTALTGYLSAGNVVFENNFPQAERNFASGTPVDVTDIRADPRFVDPDGPDDILGGASYADDQFQLGERRAHPVATSAAVDAGSDLARRLNLAGGSTRADRKRDRGIVDAGYHYDNFGAPPASPAQRLRYKSRYVNGVTGDDENDGNTPATAWQTLRKAFAEARPGHRIVIVGGTYREGNLVFPSSGKPRRPIVIQAVNGAVIDGSGAQIALALNAVSHLLLDGIAVSGAIDNGIEIRFSQLPGAAEADNIVLRRVRLSSNGSRGLSVRNSVGVVMTSSTVENNGTRGIQVENAAMRIERSIIGNNALTGLWAFGGSSVAVSNTQFNENRADNVLVEESDVSIVGGLVRGGTDGGARFKAGSTGMLEGVTVLGNVDVGVQAISSVVSLIGGSVNGSRIGVQAFVDPVLRLPTELAVEGTTICNNDDNGVDVDHATLTLVDADVCANGQDGIAVSGAIDNGIEIRFSQLPGAAEADNIVLRRVRLSSNGSRGLSVRNSVGVVMTSSTVENNGTRGIQVENAAMRIERSIIGNNALTGLWAFGGSSVAVSNTQFNENHADNVLVEESDVSIVGGLVRGGTDGGARFKVGSTGILEGVTVLGNVDVGVQAISSVVSLIGGSVNGSRIGVQAFVDPVLRLPTELAVEGTAICNSDDNGVDVDHATLTLVDADVCANGQDGLRQRGGSAIVDGGTVRANARGGISSSDADSLSVRGLTVQGNRGNGVQIARGGAFVIEDSRLFDNSGDGVTVLDTAVPQIVNNLVYRNGSDGIRVSGDSVGSPDAFVAHNTVFGNASRGLIVGGGDFASSSPNASVMRNIFRGNGGFGIQVTTLSIVGYRGNYNLNTDPYGAPSLIGVNDMQVNPQFVQPESGDFHLSQRASGQPSTSPAVDAGGINATAAGMDRKTTRTDGVIDRGIVDLGYHYSP